jgi:hypothetical protein
MIVRLRPVFLYLFLQIVRSFLVYVYTGSDWLFAWLVWLLDYFLIRVSSSMSWIAETNFKN